MENTDTQNEHWNARHGRSSPASGSAESPADICLWKSETWVDSSPLIDGHAWIKIESRAWVCPLCAQSEEYLMINGCVVRGTGMRSTMGGGISVDHCSRWQCVDKAERMTDAAMKHNDKLRDARPATETTNKTESTNNG